MPAAKQKAKPKVRKASPKAKASKPKAKPKLKASAKPKLVAKVKPVSPSLPAKKKVDVKAQHAHESVFARLLREKAERHAQFQKQQSSHMQHPNDQQMPANHARFSRFAGPRRRAS